MRLHVLLLFTIVAWLACEVPVESGSSKHSAGVTNSATSKCYPHISFPDARKASSTTWTVSGLCAAYHLPTGVSASGVIGILELGGGWVQSDLDAFSRLNGLPTIQVINVSVDGTNNGPGVDSNADVEVTLDIECAAATYYYMTGKVPAIKVYFASNSYESFVKTIEAASSDKCDVLSISWGNSEKAWKTDSPGEASRVEAAAQAATAAGMIIFAASGDYSSSDGDTGTNVDLPASCPHILGCGGTSKTTTTEIVWGDGSERDAGTGGGYSTIFPVQSFQSGAPPPSGLGRMVPDISANADPNTGIEFVVDGSQIVIGGTSVVAPFYSVFFAAVGKQLGFVSASLWASPQVFVDITSGSNGAYDANSGPDPCTGLGVPDGWSIEALFGISTTPTQPQSGVTASFDANVLSIVGSDNDSRLTVRYRQRDQTVEVEGLGGTTVNDSRSFATSVSGPITLNMELGAGNDNLRLIGLSTVGMASNIGLGGGNDVIELLFCDLGPLNIVGGAGQNYLVSFATRIDSLTSTDLITSGRGHVGHDFGPFPTDPFHRSGGIVQRQDAPAARIQQKFPDPKSQNGSQPLATTTTAATTTAATAASTRSATLPSTGKQSGPDDFSRRNPLKFGRR